MNCGAKMSRFWIVQQTVEIFSDAKIVNKKYATKHLELGFAQAGSINQLELGYMN